jgi:hypothetical protein
MAELGRRLARIEELLTAAGLPSLPAAEAPEGEQTGADPPIPGGAEQRAGAQPFRQQRGDPEDDPAERRRAHGGGQDAHLRSSRHLWWLVSWEAGGLGVVFVAGRRGKQADPVAGGQDELRVRRAELMAAQDGDWGAARRPGHVGELEPGQEHAAPTAA